MKQVLGPSPHIIEGEVEAQDLGDLSKVTQSKKQSQGLKWAGGLPSAPSVLTPTLYDLQEGSDTEGAQGLSSLFGG